MAKGQTSDATNIANNASNSVPGEVAPVIGNANQQQSTATGAAASNLSQANSNTDEATGIVNLAGPTYQAEAQTGGFTPEQETTYLNRATQGTAGTYDVLAQQAKNQEAATGGLGTGGQISQMARQGTQQQALATENAQADLTQQENANKLAGASGLNSLAQTQNTTAGVNANLYQTSEGTITAAGQQVLNALGLQNATQEESAAVLQKLASSPSTFQQWLTAIGEGGQAAAGIASGVANA